MANWDDVFDQWARWVHRGELAPSGQSMLGKLIDCQGVMNYGSGGKGAALDCIEVLVESAVLRLAAENHDAATVFRIECGATGHPLDDTQLKRAHRQGISLPTYKRRLKTAREHVINQLTKKRTLK